MNLLISVVFAFGDKAPTVPQWDLIKSHCIFCLANSGCTHYPKVFGVQGYFFKNTPHHKTKNTCKA